MTETPEELGYKKDPEIVGLKRALQDAALTHLIVTGGEALWNMYSMKLSEAGNLLYKNGEESDKKPSELITDPALYKKLEEQARERLAKSAE